LVLPGSEPILRIYNAAELKLLNLQLLNQLDRPSSPVWAAVLVPVFFGLISLFVIGQDANWDLLNYHLYNPYALLEGVVGLDLAPAGLQTYFNPLLDVPYFLMAIHWPASAVALAMGCFHGLNFVFLLAITSQFVERAERPRATAILLALAGCFSAAFLSELGNTMGDNATSVFVLAGIALLLRKWEDFALERGRYWVWLMVAGLLLGVGAGLKLTNAVYALAAVFALVFTCPGSVLRRARVALFICVGVAAGIGLTGGYWFIKMWNLYGNPLFPQFNSFFQSAMAAPIGVADVRWRPKGMLETLFFPFVFALNPARVGESPLFQIALPVLYLLFWAWAVVAALGGLFGGNFKPDCKAFPPSQRAKANFILAFAGSSYLVWLALFSIHRYLVPLEMVAPLCIWLILHRLLKPNLAKSLAKKILTGGVIFVLLLRTTWGNVGLAEQTFRVEVPLLPDPMNTAIVVLQTGQQAWLIPFFPKGVRVASLGIFPESPAYVARAKEIIARRKKNAFVILEASKDNRPERIDRLNAIFSRFGLLHDDAACALVRWSIERNSRLNAKMSPVSGAQTPCRVHLDPLTIRNLDEEDKAIAIGKAEFAKTQYSIQIDPSTCLPHSAWVGKLQHKYQFCRIF
jgi:Glycosyltransferase family 87